LCAPAWASNADGSGERCIVVRGWAEKQADRQLSARELVRALTAGERSRRPSFQLS
ncbi:uncharacterized, partial [Tachysurus ichikawai]